MRRGGGCHRAGMLPRLSPALSINLATPCPTRSKPGYGPKPNWQGQCLPVSMFTALCTPLLAGRAACLSPAPPSLLVAAPAQPHTARCCPLISPHLSSSSRSVSWTVALASQLAARAACAAPATCPMAMAAAQRQAEAGAVHTSCASGCTGTSASLCCWLPGQLCSQIPRQLPWLLTTRLIALHLPGLQCTDVGQTLAECTAYQTGTCTW